MYLFEYMQGNIVSIGDPSSSDIEERVDEGVKDGEGMSQIPIVGENVETPFNSPKFDTSADQISNPLYDKTPDVVVEENQIFDSIDTIHCFEQSSKALYDKTPNTIAEESEKFHTNDTIQCSYGQCSWPIFDMTPDSVPLGPPTFDRTPMGLDDPFDFSVNLQPSSYKCGEDPRKTVLDGKETTLFIEDDCSDGEDITMVSRGEVKNVVNEGDIRESSMLEKTNLRPNTRSRGHKRTFLTPDGAKGGKSNYRHPSFYSQSIAQTKRTRTCTIKKNRCELFLSILYNIYRVFHI
jgi:hypothetical protein